MSKQKVFITTEYIRLDQFLKLCGAVSTGGEAKEKILEGKASVNAEPCLQRGRKLRDSDTVEFEGAAYFVCRGQQKPEE